MDYFAEILGGKLDDKVGVGCAEKVGGLEVTGLDNSDGDGARHFCFYLMMDM